MKNIIETVKIPKFCLNYKFYHFFFSSIWVLNIKKSIMYYNTKMFFYLYFIKIKVFEIINFMFFF